MTKNGKKIKIKMAITNDNVKITLKNESLYLKVSQLILIKNSLIKD